MYSIVNISGEVFLQYLPTSTIPLFLIIKKSSTISQWYFWPFYTIQYHLGLSVLLFLWFFILLFQNAEDMILWTIEIRFRRESNSGNDEAEGTKTEWNW